jgi:hypothetical protein
MMFSGHTVLWAILSCGYVQYCKSRTEQLVGILGTVIGSLILIAARAHYSIGIKCTYFVDPIKMWLLARM